MLGARLAGRLTPDVRWATDASSLGFVHRRVGDADVYFVANTSNRPDHHDGDIPDIGRACANGGIRELVIGRRCESTPDAGTRTLDVALAPYGSTFFVFSPPSPAGADVGAPAAPNPVSGGGRLHRSARRHRPLDGLASRRARPGIACVDRR